MPVDNLERTCDGPNFRDYFDVPSENRVPHWVLAHHYVSAQRGSGRLSQITQPFLGQISSKCGVIKYIYGISSGQVG